MFESDSALYWRRRGVAIASVVAVVLILVWAMSGPGDPASGDQATESLSTAGVSLQSPADSSPVPAAGEPVAGSTQPVGANGQSGTVPAAGLPAAGLPAAGLPAAGLPAAGLPAAGLPAAGLPAAGLPAAGLPAAGSPAAGLPAAGLPAAGVPAAGLPGGETGTVASGRATAGGMPANGARSPIPTGLSPNSSVGAGPDVAPQADRGQVPPAQAGQRPVQLPAAGRPGAATAENTRAKPAAVVPCSDKAISVQAQTGAESYKVGQKPRFQLLVTNVGSKPCTRNLDPGLQEMVVTGGPANSRLWSSNDCFPAKRSEVRTLQPGKPLVFPLDWAGRTSSPGCSGERRSIGPGSYVLTAKLGSLSSGPARFTIVQ